MKMNKILYIAIFCLSLTSCTKWLTVDPTDQVSEPDLYATAEGYHNQINGVYKAMAGKSLYGQEMTWGLMDVLAQYYDFENMEYNELVAYREGAASQYSYQHAGPLALIKSIWEESYSAIANCNDLIAHTENADSSLFEYKEMERKVILGEAYALRAMLHFDLLRAFAPAPIKNNDDAYIPYVKEFPIHIPMKMKSSEVLKNAIEDLEAAEKLVAQYDIAKNELSNLRARLELAGTRYHFLGFRGYRLNYSAIQALIARVSLYAGDKEKALRYAEGLIQQNWFKFSTSSNFNEGDTKLYSDAIFALYNNKYVDYFRSINLDDTRFLTLMDYEGIFGDDGTFEVSYNPDGTVGSSKDNRELRAKQWEYVSGEECYRSIKMNKNNGTSGKEEYSNKMIPMLRISEMYYIASECLFETDKTQARVYLETVRKGRGVKKPALEELTTKENFYRLLVNEMRREFYGEGQLFFFYKRLNLRVETKNGESLPLDKEFVLPIPTSNDIN